MEFHMIVAIFITPHKIPELAAVNAKSKKYSSFSEISIYSPSCFICIYYCDEIKDK